MGKRGPQTTPIGELIFWENLWYWVFRHLRGVMPSAERAAQNRELRNTYRLALQELNERVPRDVVEEHWLNQEKNQLRRELTSRRVESEPAVWRALVEARTAAAVRKACGQSKRWLNSKWQGRTYVQDLYDHANQFVCAKNENPYYPRLESGDEKRIKFFARAMAGITFGVSPNTAIDKLRKLKHGPECPCIHCELKRSDQVEEYIFERIFGSGVKTRDAQDNQKSKR